MQSTFNETCKRKRYALKLILSSVDVYWCTLLQNTKAVSSVDEHQDHVIRLVTEKAFQKQTSVEFNFKAHFPTSYTSDCW